MEKKALGRGLSALIPSKDDIEQLSTVDRKPADTSHQTVMQLPVGHIVANKYQPRFEFSEDKLKELINSIKEKGVVQPVLVRKKEAGYELIAGERRLRAVRSLGMKTIPAIVKDATDLDMLEIALIENIQREDLNPLEEASAYQRFVSEFKFTQDKIAQVLGKDRSTVANMMRLLSLPLKIQEFISNNSITAGHGKALLGLPTEAAQMRIATIIVKKGLSVRETEHIISKRLSGAKKIEPKKDPQITDIEAVFQQKLGTKVKIVHGKKRGKIIIEYYSISDLNRIIDLVTSKKA